MSNIYQVGNVRVTCGSKIVIGIGTSWLTYVSPGSSFEVDGIVYSIYQVIDVATIELTVPYAGETKQHTPYRIAAPK